MTDEGAAIQHDHRTVPLAALIENYTISIFGHGETPDRPGIICRRLGPEMFGARLPCWIHVFEDFYDNPHDLTLGDVIDVAANHEWEKHISHPTEEDQ